MLRLGHSWSEHYVDEHKKGLDSCVGVVQAMRRPAFRWFPRDQSGISDAEQFGFERHKAEPVD